MKKDIIQSILKKRGIEPTEENLILICRLWKKGESTKESLLKFLCEENEMNKITFGRMISELIRGGAIFERRRGDKKYLSLEETFAADLIFEAARKKVKVAKSKVKEFKKGSKEFFGDSKEFAKEFGDEFKESLLDLGDEIDKVSKKGRHNLSKFLKKVAKKIDD